MYILFSKRLLNASSMSQGKLVAAKTITTLLASSLEFKPSICTSNSDLTLREASCSDSEPLREHSESISSMKMVDGA